MERLDSLPADDTVIALGLLVPKGTYRGFHPAKGGNAFYAHHVIMVVWDSNRSKLMRVVPEGDVFTRFAQLAQLGAGTSFLFEPVYYPLKPPGG